MKNRMHPPQRGHASLLSIALAIVLAFVASCQMPGLMPGVKADEGSINILLATENPKTLVPSIDMTVATYVVAGTGPSNASFTTTVATTSTTVGSLAAGSWAITADGKNATGTIVSHGGATVSVAAAGTQTVSITASPVVGPGSLSLTASWPASGVQSPSIQAQLTPATGSSLTLAFSSPASGSATYAGSGIQNGYYTLTVKLYDGTQLVAGAVEVVWIVAGQNTAGTFNFSQISTGKGSILVNITPQMANPLQVALSGTQPTIGAGAATTVTATTTGYVGNVTYVWYLNGASLGTGASYSFNTAANPLAIGNYRMDVTAFSADGTRAGSATSAFTVAKVDSLNLAWNANTESNIAGYKLYMGTTSGVYGAPIDVGLVTTYVVQNLVSGTTYYFAITAYNTSGLESAKSTAITYAAP
jgi:hypothetical protein